MRHDKIRDIVFFSIIAALEIILAVTGVGYINIGTIASITILHIPVLVGAVVLGWKYGALLGGIFGLTSLILAFVYLGVNAPFTNPLVSLIPRILLGMAVYPLHALFKKWFKNKWISSALSFGVCTLLHSIVVLTVLYVVGKTGFYFYASSNPYSGTDGTNILLFVVGAMSINALIEIALAMLIAAPISQALEIVIYKNKAQEEENSNELDSNESDSIESEANTESETENKLEAKE